MSTPSGLSSAMPDLTHCKSHRNTSRRIVGQHDNTRLQWVRMAKCASGNSSSEKCIRTRHTSRRHSPSWALHILGASLFLPAALAQSCISLADSTECSAFKTSSISTNSNLTGLFSFLSNVTDVSSFDSGIQSYISGAFTRQRYQQLIGCSSVNLSDASAYYARYTTSVLCNAIVQNSIDACSLIGHATTPLCADSCAEYAQSEQQITDSSVCGTAGSRAASQIRADLTDCALPANSLSGSCIEAAINEPNNCGFSSSLTGLCSYCAASSPNATDSCCVFSDVTTRCQGVVLPIVATSSETALSGQISTIASSSSGSPTLGALTNAGRSSGTLSGGQIAGVVVGSVLGALLLLGLLILACVIFRRRHRSSEHSVSSLDGSSGQGDHTPFAAMPGGVAMNEKDPTTSLYGGRVTRMSALEGDNGSSHRQASPALGYGSLPSTYDSTPESQTHYGVAAAPIRGGSAATARRHTDVNQDSPASSDGSEQLSVFGDYYSEDDIRVGDLVSTLWAYQPHAPDEFELERGDMLKVSGIWDDGWATGVRVRMRAEDWRDSSKTQRDSGMSHDDSPDNSPGPDSDVKAFPLVCVCIPRQWKKTIEGDTTSTTATRQEGTHVG